MNGTAWQRMLATRAPAAAILIRILVGWVFLCEGIGKFLYSAEQAAGRFEKIPAIPAPHVMGPFVGGVEVIFGSLILLGLCTRLSAVPLLINISVAILTTKIPLLMGHSCGMPKNGSFAGWWARSCCCWGCTWDTRL